MRLGLSVALLGMLLSCAHNEPPTLTPEQQATRDLAWSQGIADGRPPTTEWYRGVTDGGVGQMLEIEARDQTSATYRPDSVVVFLDDVLLFSPENQSLINGRIREKPPITWHGAITPGPHKLRAIFGGHVIDGDIHVFGISGHEFTVDGKLRKVTVEYSSRAAKLPQDGFRMEWKEEP